MIVKNKKSFDERIFNIQLICVVFVTLFETLRIDFLAELALILNFSVAPVMALASLVKRLDTQTAYSWLFVVVTSFSGVVVTSRGVSFDYLETWIMFMITLCLFFWISSVDVTKGMIKNFFIAGGVVGVLFVGLYFTGYAYNTDNIYMKSANFGLSNPNLAAIYLLNVVLIILISFEFMSNKKLKLPFMIFVVLLGYFIFLTQSRACIIALLAFVWLRSLKIKKFSKGMNFFMIILPLIFVWVYLAIVDSDVMNLFEFATMDGKVNSSRVSIWERKIFAIKNNFIFGDYYNERGNAHNIYMSVLVSYGVITFISLISFLNRITNKIGVIVKEKYQFLALFAFYAIIVSGTFEAALFTGSQGMYVFSGGFLMIAKYMADEKENNAGDGS